MERVPIEARDIRERGTSRIFVKKGLRESRKVIVFAAVRATLDYLEERLIEDGFQHVRIDGTVVSKPADPDQDIRGQRIRAFRDDESVDILLSSEVGSEGLDFQFCSTIINWDLPWNPMRVEQRIGRIDRIGQRSDTLFIGNIVCEGTIEERILERLYKRLNIFEQTIGELEPILGDIVSSLERQLLQPNLSSEERERIMDQELITLERQVKQQARLEERCGDLIGHDEYFKEQLSGIQRKAKYVAGPELRVFVQHELANQLPSCAIRESRDSDVWILEFDHTMGPFVERHLNKRDPEVRRFIATLRDRSQPNRYAFDGDVAEGHPGVEPLHGRHPLVAALAKGANVDENQAEIAHFAVQTDTIPAGKWLLGWFLTTETGFMERRELMACAIRLDQPSFPAATQDQADSLLADGIRRGQPAGVLTPPDLEVCRILVGLLEDVAMGWVSTRRTERSERFAAIKARRRDVVAGSYTNKILRQREVVEKMEQSESRLVHAARGKLAKLEQSRESKLDEVELLKEGVVHHHFVGAGFVKVTPLDRQS